MSLILDALRRAESERRSGDTPGIHELPTATAAPRQGLHPAWLAVAAAAAFLIAMLLWPSPQQSPAGETAAVATTPIPARQPPADTAPATSPVAPTVPRKRPTVRSLDDLMPAPPDPPAEPAESTPAATRPEPAAQSESPATIEEPATDVSAVDSAGPAPEPGAPPAASATPETPTIETQRTRLPPDMLMDGPAATPLVDMPAAYRSDFPRIRVDVHVYDEQPQRRFVLLNLKRYREGQTTQEGLQIIEILPAAIVFSYRGERVLYQLQR